MYNIKKILPFFLLLIFTLFLRINAFNLPYERDEGEYAYIAYFAKQGVVPYRDVFDQKPPLIFLMFYAGEIINPGGTWGPRLLATTFTFAAAVLLYFIGKKLFDEKTGLVSMWLFIAMLTIPKMTPFSANTEIFMLPFVLGCCLIFVNFRNSSKKIPWFIFGVLSSIAVMFKPICIPLLSFIFILWMYEDVLRNRNFKKIPVNISFTILGIISVITPIFIYLVKNNAFKPFVDAVIVYNLQYSQTFQDGGLSRFFKVITGLFENFPFIFASILIYILSNRRNLWLHLGILFVLFFPIHNSPILHYYLITIPFLALFASAGLNYLLKKFDLKYQVFGVFLTYLFIFSATLINLHSILSSKEELLQKTYDPNPFSNSIIFADILKKHTTPDDKIFMLAHEPQVLYYSKRQSASRFFYIYPILIPTAKAKAYENEYINDLLTKDPKFIVYSPYVYSGIVQSGATQLFFNKVVDIIQEKYEIVGGCTFSENCRWTENVDAGNSGEYSFILFRKIM